MEKDFVTIGVITRPHGVKGEVRVLPLTDFPERFEELIRVRIVMPEDDRNLSVPAGLDLWKLAAEGLEVEKVGYFKNYVILKLQGIDDRDAAEGLKNFEIVIPRAERVRLPEDHYFISDILGMQVETVDGDNLGLVQDVITTGGTDVYVVGEEGLMLPATKEVVKKIDLDRGVMVVELLEGLEDLKTR